ncbi:MAG: hypothetical protein ACP5U2_15470 [Bryobacteraceae bacterium]
MVGGCPTDARLWGCLYHEYPEICWFAAAVAAGLVVVWRRWALLLVGVVTLGVAALWRAWGVLH